MARRTAPPDDDAIAFAEAMRGAKGLSGPTRVVSSPLPSSAPPPAAPWPHAGRLGDPAAWGRDPARLGRAPSDRLAAAMFAPDRGETDEEDSWRIRGDGIDARAMKRLRNGEFPIEARIDLHGLTRPRAERAMERFLAAARSSQRRGLLIVHGRGLHSGAAGPALRSVVRDALRHGEHASAVLAASCPAPPALGGAGATLVWLRRS
jgi:DNA-nicking Smr family endonuclease